MRNSNFWNLEDKPIPKSFYQGNTGIEPVDVVIKNIIKFGYCHHIERLMIVGNFMLLCRIHPTKLINGLWKCLLIPMIGLWSQMFTE